MDYYYSEPRFNMDKYRASLGDNFTEKEKDHLVAIRYQDMMEMTNSKEISRDYLLKDPYNPKK